MKDFRPANKRADVSVGESVRIIRELQGQSQDRLAELSGIPHVGGGGPVSLVLLGRTEPPPP